MPGLGHLQSKFQFHLFAGGNKMSGSGRSGTCNLYLFTYTVSYEFVINDLKVA